MARFKSPIPPTDDRSDQPMLISPDFFVPPTPPVGPVGEAPSSPVGLGQGLRQGLQQWGDRLIQHCFAALLGQDQPQVTWRRDAQGYEQYRVYDPRSQRSHTFDSAQAVRIWLEQRYYA